MNGRLADAGSVLIGRSVGGSSVGSGAAGGSWRRRRGCAG